MFKLNFFRNHSLNFLRKCQIGTFPAFQRALDFDTSVDGFYIGVFPVEKCQKISEPGLFSLCELKLVLLHNEGLELFPKNPKLNLSTYVGKLVG